MLLLALDTATENGSLALAAEDRLLAVYSLESPGTYLQQLLPGVEELLRAAGRNLQEVGAIAVSQGPGNFTGLRIGLATAKSLAWALDIPLVPVPTLEALAAQLPHQAQPTAVIIDAKREEVYLGVFQCPAEIPQPLGEPERLPVAALPARLQPPLLLTGPGLKVYGDFLKKHLHPEIAWASPEKRQPQAGTIAHLGRHRLQQGRTIAPPQLVPTYLRPAL